MLLTTLISSSILLASPPSCSSSCTMSETLASAVSEKAGDIVDVASSAGDFTTLLAAAKAAGLVEALRAPGPFTVLAPTDEAFAKLPAGTVESLLKPENKDKLRTILLYHVIPGRVYSDTVVTLKGAKTAAGLTAPITVRKGDGKSPATVMVGGSKVVKTDIDASNGVIHVVDAVILPE